jgi:hypothetical protein
MKALLLSDQGMLQMAFERLLHGIDDTVALWCCEAIVPARACLHQKPPLDLVLIDLAWCGALRLPQVVNDLRPGINASLIVVLADGPADALAARTSKVADLILLKTEPAQAIRTTLAQQLVRHALQQTAAVAARPDIMV